MLRRVGVRAREHEDPLRPVRERRPHLLAGDHPLVAVEHGAGLHVGEVGAGVGLGVALAPDLGAARGCRAAPRRAARRSRSARSSGRAALRRRCRRGPGRRHARTPRRRSSARRASRRGRRARRASRGRSSRRGRAPAPTPSARRSTRARRRVRRARAPSRSGPSRRSVSHARASARKRSCSGVKCRSKRRDGTKVALVCSAAWKPTGVAVVTGASRGDRAGGRDRARATRASTWSRRCATRPTARTSPSEAGAGTKLRVDRLDVNDRVDDATARRACACS